ncbi:hypothetical protein LXL04_019313 [Taraxacum kok-saghyz]
MKQLTCLFPSKVTIKMPQVLSRVGFDCSKPPTSMHSSIDNDRGVLTSSCLHETLNEGGWCFGQSKKRQIKDTMNLVIKKRKEYEEKMKEKGEALVMFRVVLAGFCLLSSSMESNWCTSIWKAFNVQVINKTNCCFYWIFLLFLVYFRCCFFPLNSSSLLCVWCYFNAELVNLSCFEVT